MAVRVERYRFTVDDYDRMRVAGILTEDSRVELIGGEIIAMAPIGSRHAGCVKRLVHALSLQLAGRAILSVQDPIRLSRYTEPQPDVALLRPREDFYASGHPGPGDVGLVVEVAETSADYDRTMKIPLYGRAGIPEAWLVDLAEGVVEVYRRPGRRGYRQVDRHGRGSFLSPQAWPDIRLAVDEVIG
ncbi:MAG: Uma2 family endonuclease [Acidobacteria bacterium]|nr:Uma2 family endonuclease [Acidobacteriota bacterium]